MKLSLSNIAWSTDLDNEVYLLMQRYGFVGLEIAPTRIFPERPYDKLQEATQWAKYMKNKYGFSISSMQSIWYGRQEKLFGTDEERRTLIDYTKRAIDFATAIECKNLVFGCPRNRAILEKKDLEIGVDFFGEIGAYAADKGTVIGMEANPPIYNTNYINDTISALKLIEEVGAKGFLLNLDVGTMIQNNECIDLLEGKVRYINHVHISEPGLQLIEKRSIHNELKELLLKEKYSNYVSIEMGKLDEVKVLEKTLDYVKGVFE